MELFWTLFEARDSQRWRRGLIKKSVKQKLWEFVTETEIELFFMFGKIFFGLWDFHATLDTKKTSHEKTRKREVGTQRQRLIIASSSEFSVENSSTLFIQECFLKDFCSIFLRRKRNFCAWGDVSDATMENTCWNWYSIGSGAMHWCRVSFTFDLEYPSGCNRK